MGKGNERLRWWETMTAVIDRRQALALGLVANLLDQPAKAATPPKSQLAMLADAFITGGYAAGVALGLRQGRRAPTFAYRGFANLETRTPVTGSTVFRIASVTKQFVAALILQLCAEKAISLETPINTYFQDFPKGDLVNLRHLLTHTSGLHDYVWGGLPADVSDNFAMLPRPHASLARMKDPWDFEPGMKYNYSNSGYLLLGEIAELIGGAGLAILLRERLFGPLHMTSTALDSNSEIVTDRASGYEVDQSANGKFVHAPFTTLPFSAGALRSTARDLLVWNKALYSGRVLGPTDLAQMIAPARLNDGRSVGEARWTPDGSIPRPPSFVQRGDYGMGLEVTVMFETPLLFHSGGISGFNALLFHCPKTETDLVAIANTGNGCVAQFEQLVRLATGA